VTHIVLSWTPGGEGLRFYVIFYDSLGGCFVIPT
jgi:hypothetical protein